MKIQPVIDDLIAIALVNALERHNIVAGARCGPKIERHGLAPPRRLDAIDLVELLDPALYLRGVASARLESFDELDLFGQHRLLAFELRLLLLLVLLSLLRIELITAGIGGE